MRRPSGRNQGDWWPVSPAASVVNGVHAPPAALTLCSGAFVDGANTMRLSRFHAPPPGGAAVSHSGSAVPPLTSIVFSFPWAKNPTERLSADQNGNPPPSLPRRGRVVCDASDRIHRLRSGDIGFVANTTWRPSGDTAKVSPIVRPSAGGAMVNSTRSARERHFAQVNDREGSGGYCNRAQDRRNRPRHPFARAPLRGNRRRQTYSAAALRDPRQLDLGVVSRLVTRVRIFCQARADEMVERGARPPAPGSPAADRLSGWRRRGSPASCP